MAFETLLAIAAEGDRQTLADMAAKYPSLKAHFELGEQLETAQPSLREMQLDLTGAVKEVKDWRAWKDKDWVIHQEELGRTKTLLETATARVQELEQRLETDMSPDEIKEVVKATLAEAGLVSSADLETKLTKLVDEKVNPTILNATNDLTNRFEGVYGDLTPLILEHKDNFNERLDPKKVFEHMQEMAKKTGVHISKISAADAYNDMVAPRLAEKREAQHKAEVEAARAEGRREAAREAASTSSGRGNPVDGRGAVKLGPLQRKQMEKFAPKEGEAAAKAPLGRGVIAARESAAHRERELAASS